MKTKVVCWVAMMAMLTACAGAPVKKHVADTAPLMAGSGGTTAEALAFSSYSEFEAHIIRRIMKKDVAVFQDLFDRERFGTQVYTELKPELEPEKIGKNLEKFSEAHELFGAYLPSPAEYDWQYLNTRKTIDTYSLNYRVLDGDSNLFFISLQIAARKDGYAIFDMVNHNIGMPLSRYMVEILKLYDGSDRLAEKEIALPELKQARDAGPDAVDDYLGRSWSGPPNGFLYFVKRTAFDDQSSNAYRDHLERSLSDYEQHGWFAMDAYAYFHLAGKDELRKAALEKVIESTGDKSYWYALEADILSAPEDFNMRIELLYQALLSDPQYMDAYYGLLNAFVANSNFEDAVMVLDVLTHHFRLDITPEEIIGIDDYNHFIQSDAFKKWAEKLASG